jgi:hypothetical protein
MIIKNMNNYFAVIVSFFGFFIGMVIAHFSKEELVKGKKYFKYFRKIILAAIGVAITYYAWGSPFYFITGMICGYFLRGYYFYIGMALALTSGKEPFLLLASLIFIFGLPHGTLIFKKFFNDKKRFYKIILFNIILFIIPFLIFSEIKNYSLLMFAAGALVIQYFIKKHQKAFNFFE